MTTQADAPASTEALDAAAAAAPPAAGSSSPAAPPSPESPAPVAGSAPSGEGTPSLSEYVEDDTLDLSASGLPEQTVEELKQLRRESRQRKEFVQQWQPAMQGWTDEDISQLRQALEMGPSNPDVIGEWMLNSAKALLGERFEQVIGGAPDPDAPQVGDDDGEGGTLTIEDVKRLMAEERAEAEKQAAEAAAKQAQVQSIVDQTTALGFGPTHWAHKTLLLTARDETNGDLQKAAELLKERNVTPESNGTADDSQQAAGGQPQQAAGHTPAATTGGTPAGTQRPSSPRAAAEERITAKIGNARGFNSL